MIDTYDKYQLYYCRRKAGIIENISNNNAFNEKVLNNRNLLIYLFFLFFRIVSKKKIYITKKFLLID